MSSIPVFGTIGQVPASIAGLKLVDVLQYENPDMGTLFKYGFPPTLTADAYLYNNGFADIPADLRSPFLANSFREQHQGILMMGNMGTIRDVDVLRSAVLAHPGDQNIPLCYWSTFAYRHIEREMRFSEVGVAREGDGVVPDVGRLISHLTLRSDRGFFNKVRFTYVERASDPAYFGVTAEDLPDPALDWFLRFVADWTYAVQTAPVGR